jgi:hypothetical protein
MARSPRFIQPRTVFEITMRTDGARLYLRPSAALNARILATLGRALALYPVELHAFAFMSNHWHALVTPLDAPALASFLRYVHSNVAKAAQEINGIVGGVWQRRRAEVIPVLGADAEYDRLRYILSQGTKEHLVSSPFEWPGVTSARALAGREELVGDFVDRAALRSILRSGRRPFFHEYRIRYPIELTPLPSLARYPLASRIRLTKAIVAEIEFDHPGPHLGVGMVLTQDPMSRPRDSKNRPPPLIHCKDPDYRNRYRFLLAAFRGAYRGAAILHGLKPTVVEWPADACLPTLSFVTGRSPPLVEMLAWARPSTHVTSTLV